MAHPTVGIIGGGQLGKMIAQEARRMSIPIVVLDPTPNCPAASVADRQITADFKDPSAIRALAEASDVVTYEIELGDNGILKTLEEEGRRISPSAETLRVVQDKLLQKEFLKKNGVPVPEFKTVELDERLSETVRAFGYPCLIKCRTDSYDGRGNWTLRGPEDLDALIQAHAFNGATRGKQYMLERFVAFVKEVSVMAARNDRGQTVTYPVVENVHQNHILIKTIAPAQIPPAVAEKARQVALQSVHALNGVGIFGVELFVTAAGDVLLNEIAPRPHNSGHYTIEACGHSQFETHLRAILGWPLVDPHFHSPAVMLNILGQEDSETDYHAEGVAELLAIPGAKLHLYGKRGLRRKRKLGHITIIDKTIEGALAKAEQAQGLLKLVPNQGGSK